MCESASLPTAVFRNGKKCVQSVSSCQSAAAPAAILLSAEALRGAALRIHSRVFWFRENSKGISYEIKRELLPMQ